MAVSELSETFTFLAAGRGLPEEPARPVGGEAALLAALDQQAVPHPPLGVEGVHETDDLPHTVIAGLRQRDRALANPDIPRGNLLRQPRAQRLERRLRLGPERLRPQADVLDRALQPEPGDL